MEFVKLAGLCLLSWPAMSFGDESGTVVVKVVVEEGGDAMLPCSLSTKENIEKKVFDWKKDGQKEVFLYDAGVHYNNGREGQDEEFKGRVSYFVQELKNGNASIIIKNVNVADSGNYTCLFPHHQLQSLTFPIVLVVDQTLKDRSSENIPGAAKKPSTMILDATEDRVPLNCEVEDSSPEPKLEWQDSEGNILHAKEPQVSEKGGRYSVSMNTTVTKTKTNLFLCVATQRDIGHRIAAPIYVPDQMFEECKMSGQVSGQDIGAWIAWIFLAFCIGVVATLVAIYIKRKYKKDSSQQTPDDQQTMPMNQICSQCQRPLSQSDTNGHVK